MEEQVFVPICFDKLKALVRQLFDDAFTETNFMLYLRTLLSPRWV
jgi:hypothetical protein